LSTSPKPVIPVPDVLAPYLLNRAAGIVRRMAEIELAPFGISPKHYGILATISANSSLTQQSLGELLRIDRTTIVQLVDELEGKGAVVRGPTPGDRRAYSLELTVAGKALLQETGQRMLATQERFFGPLRPSERKELQRLLMKLVEEHASSQTTCTPEEKE
jgi:DNA-binding MarR family transcriptional regulator